MEPVSETRLGLVNSVLADRVRSLEAALSFPLRVTQGLRKAAEQEALHSQGRFALNIVNAQRAAVGWAGITADENLRKVTNAGPRESWHEYGLAVDVVPFIDGVPVWGDKDKWQQIAARAPEFKLKSGIAWNDAPHLQPEEIPASPNSNYKQSLMTASLQGAWDYARLEA